MFNFNNILIENEKILYQGEPVPGKGDKNIGGLLFVLAFLIFIMALICWRMITETGDSAQGMTMGIIIIILFLFSFMGLIIYGIIYNVFLKKRMVADDIFCLTNFRALKYETKKQKLTCGYLQKFEIIVVENEKDGYGDVQMSYDIPDNLSEDEQAHFLKEKMRNKNPNDVSTMVFECVANPHKVKNIAQQARNQLLENTQYNQYNNFYTN